MVWLIVLLSYFIPLIVVLLIIYYCELDSGETFAEYFRHNEYVLLATVVPVFNIIGMIAVIIAPIVQIIGNIKKP
jgi:hypothetical protein